MIDADIIKSIRKEVRLSQRDIADKLGVSQSAISSIESGRHPIYYELFKLMVNILGVNPWYFIRDGESMFVTGKNEISALKKKIAAYEKLLDKMNDVKIKGS